jgi:hypothetical protein
LPGLSQEFAVPGGGSTTEHDDHRPIDREPGHHGTDYSS